MTFTAEDQARLDFVIGARNAEAQGFTDLVNQELARQAAAAPATPATPATPPPNPATTSPTIVPPTGDPLTQSAITILADALTQAGLGSLAQTIWGWWKEGRSLEQINLDIRNTPEFKTRFAGLAALEAKGRSISPAAYISAEQGYAAAMRAAGLPASFYDAPADFANLIGNEVSPAEFNDRLTAYTTLSNQMPREVLDAFAQQGGYADWAQTGWSNGDLAAFFIDPTQALPAIQKRLTQAEIGGASQFTGYGRLSSMEQERLQSLGVDYTKAQQGFSTLAHLSPLFSALPGEDPNSTVSRQSQLDALFAQNAAAQDEITRAEQRRLSPFQTGGGFAGSQRGQTGAGGAR